MKMDTAVMVALFIVGGFCGIIGTMIKVIFSNMNEKMTAHETLDTDRFDRMEKMLNTSHSENIEASRRLSRAQQRMTGALIVALSNGATPEERRDIVRDLREDS